MNFNFRQAPSNHQIKGKVLVTDPCYIIPELPWDDFCEQLEIIEEKSFKNTGTGWVKTSYLFDYNGHTCIVGPTAYGDGFYPAIADNIEGEGVAVDAGLIAIFPQACFETVPTDLGVRTEVDGEFEYNEGNFFVCGPKDLEVWTKDQEDPDDEEEDEEE